jgi:hypothetical protein
MTIQKIALNQVIMRRDNNHEKVMTRMICMVKMKRGNTKNWSLENIMQMK